MMRSIVCVLLFAGVLVASSWCRTAWAPFAQSGAPSSPTATVPEGFVSLFNGVNLDGWLVKNRGTHDWRVVEGVIDCDPHKGPGDRNLWSAASCGNFELLVRLAHPAGPLCQSAAKMILPDGIYQKNRAGHEVLITVPNTDSGT
jgi:3-keto-disaccharide hydrolase